MRTLIIGGSQFNGYFLVKELVEGGDQVAVLNRGKTRAEFPDGVEVLLADRTDPKAVAKAIGKREFDCVYDMCAYHPNDVRMVLDIFKDRVGHYIFASSTAIYASTEILPITEQCPLERGENQNEYGLHKILCEDILFEAFQENGFPATVVPFSMVMGPRNIIPDREQRMIKRILLDRPVLVPGDGTTLGQVGSVVDQARALSLLKGNSNTFGKRYNLTSKEYFSDLGYIRAFEKALGKKANLVFIPSHTMEALWDGEIQLDMSAPGTRVNVDIRPTKEGRKRQTKSTTRYRLVSLIQRLAPNIHRWNKSVFFSIDRLCQETGFEPEYTFDQMAAEVLEWMQKEAIDPDFDWSLEDQICNLIST